jgi:hypothetical protein
MVDTPLGTVELSRPGMNIEGNDRKRVIAVPPEQLPGSMLEDETDPNVVPVGLETPDGEADVDPSAGVDAGTGLPAADDNSALAAAGEPGTSTAVPGISVAETPDALGAQPGPRRASRAGMARSASRGRALRAPGTRAPTVQVRTVRGPRGLGAEGWGRRNRCGRRRWRR